MIPTCIHLNRYMDRWGLPRGANARKCVCVCGRDGFSLRERWVLSRFSCWRLSGAPLNKISRACARGGMRSKPGSLSERDLIALIPVLGFELGIIELRDGILLVRLVGKFDNAAAMPIHVGENHVTGLAKEILKILPRRRRR